MVKITSIIIVLCTLIISCKANNVENMDTIKEKTFIQVNDNKIGMFIEGNNLNAPVLLFLHGGPGMPQYGLTQKYPTFLEENFIVCWYEQRGAGLSYDKTIDYEQM